MNDLSREEFGSQIQERLKSGNAREAIELSKQCIKKFGQSVGEPFLSQSYELRIQQLLKAGLNKEAAELAQIATLTCPSSKERFTRLFIKGFSANASLEDLIRLIGKNPQDRTQEEAESQLALRLDDPLTLVQSPFLSSGHPLRMEAQIASGAWEAILSGQYEGEVFESLKNISRRSPLRYWKLFIRGVSAFYRREDALSRENLLRIPSSCRLAPAASVLCSIMKSDSVDYPDIPWTHQMHRIAREIAGEEFYLKRDLAIVDKALKERKYRDAIQYFNVIADRLGEFKEYLLDDLRITFFHIFFPSLKSQTDLFYKLGVTSPWDAIRLRSIGLSRDMLDIALEGWKSSLEYPGKDISNMEMGLICQFMANLSSNALHLSKERDDRFWGDFDYDDEYDTERELPFFLRKETPDPEKLYRESLSYYPHPEVYRALVKYLDQDSPRAAENAALEWVESFPDDIEPLIYLAQNAYKRKAYNKSFQFLTKAEKLNPLHTEVRNLKFQATLHMICKKLDGKSPPSASRGLETLKTISRTSQQAGLANALLVALQVLTQDKEAFYSAVKNALNSSPEPDWEIFAITDVLIRHVPGQKRLFWINFLPRLGATDKAVKAFYDHAIFFAKMFSEPRYLISDLNHIMESINPETPEDILAGVSGMEDYACREITEIKWKAQLLGLSRRGKFLPLFLVHRAQWHYRNELSYRIFSSRSRVYRDELCAGSAIFLAKEQRDFELARQINSLVAKMKIDIDFEHLKREDVERIIDEEIQAGMTRSYPSRRKKTHKAQNRKKKRVESPDSQKGAPEQLEIPF